MGTFKRKGSGIRNSAAYERVWSPVGLGLSCVLAAFGLCLRADNQLLAVYDLEGVAGLFACSFLIGVVLLCMVVLVSAHDEEQRRWSIGIGLTVGVGGVVFGLLASVLPVAVSATGAGVFLGFGLTCLLRQWGRYYRLLSYRGALLSTALSFLAAACWWFAMEFAGTPFLFCLGLLVLVVCGGLPLLAREIVHSDEVRAGLRDDDPSPRVSSTMSQAMRDGWAAVVGLMLNFFMIGLTFWPDAASSPELALFPKPLSYLVLLAVVWWVVSRTHQAIGGIMERFYRVSLPLAALVMLACPLVASAAGLEGTLALSAVSYLGVAVCNVLGLVVLFWTAKSSEVGFSKVFAAFCASCAASVTAGMVVFQLLGSSAELVATVLLAAYLATMVLAEARAAVDRRRSACQVGAAEELRDLAKRSE